MVFRDVLHDGLVICSLQCSVEHSLVLWELGIHTTVVFALMWAIYLLRCPLTLSLLQSTLQLSSGDYTALWVVVQTVTFNFMCILTWKKCILYYFK